MIRKPHKLKRNKITYIPTNFIFFDCETKPIKKNKKTVIHKLILGHAVYWKRSCKTSPEIEQWIEFEDIETFWKFVLSKITKKTRLILIAHNIVFDFTIVDGFNYLTKNDWRLTRLYEKGKVFVGKFQYPTSKSLDLIKTQKDINYKKDVKYEKSLVLLDNMNYFSTSLKILGKNVGVEKLEVDFNKVSKKELNIYCKQDVNILLQTWKKYLNWFMENDLGNFGITISSQAFNTFRHRFMNTDIFIHNRRAVLNLERESYFGGRTECFKLGNFTDDTFYYLDINSMYPAVMFDNKFPTKFLSYDLNIKPIVLELMMKKFSAVARVIIKTKNPIVPTRMNNKLVYPVGKFETVLSTPELKLVIEEKCLYKVISATYYEDDFIFKEFINFFYTERVKAKHENNIAYVLFFKLLMNSLYGKFGQKVGQWETIGKCKSEEVEYWSEFVPSLNKVYRMRKISGLIQCYKREQESFNSFPAISSHVTSFARVKLYEFMKIADPKNVYYCDTDSLFVNSKGYERLKPFINNYELGYLKLESVSNKLEIKGCKNYIFGDLNKHKGLSKSALKIAENTYKQLQWSSLKTMIRNQNLKDYEVKEIIKVFSNKYDKGNVLNNGDIEPFLLDI